MTTGYPSNNDHWVASRKLHRSGWWVWRSCGCTMAVVIITWVGSPVDSLVWYRTAPYINPWIDRRIPSSNNDHWVSVWCALNWDLPSETTSIVISFLKIILIVTNILEIWPTPGFRFCHRLPNALHALCFGDRLTHFLMLEPDSLVHDFWLCFNVKLVQ